MAEQPFPIPIIIREVSTAEELREEVNEVITQISQRLRAIEDEMVQLKQERQRG